MRSVCVFCGSNPGNDPVYAEGARAMGREIARRGIVLVYGGGAVGLMGIIADAALAAGGEVHGVIPKALRDKEVGHHGLTRLEIVDTMHTRKARMAELSDGFVTMPGGIGTFEEAFETMTWTQLGVHDKPIALVDVDGFYAPAAALLDRAVAEDFLSTAVRSSIVVAPSTPAALDAFATWSRPALGKWTELDGGIGPDRT